MTKSDLQNNGRINDQSQAAYIRRYSLIGGEEDGLKVVECNSGKLRFLLNESKALDIMQIFYNGENTSFVSKNGFSARETDFINRFEGGALYTCGLDAAGEVAGKKIHGRLHNIPAKITRAELAEDGIIVEAEIRFTALFGENLTIRRKIFSPYYSGKIELSDVLYNFGGKDAEFCILYHTNLGYPLLTENGKIFANVKDVTPRNAHAKDLADKWNEIFPPEDDAEEVCYYIKPKDNTVRYVNEKTGRKFTLSYGKEINKVIIWKSWQSGDYALGIEPTTTFLDENFSYEKLPARSDKKFNISITIE